MNILDLKRKAQGFHALEGGGGNGRDYYNQTPQISEREALLNSVASQTASNQSSSHPTNYSWVPARIEGTPRGSDMRAIAGFWKDPNDNGGWGGPLGGVLNSVSDAVSTDDFRKAAQVAALAYGGYNLYDAYAGAGAAASAGGGGASALDLASGGADALSAGTDMAGAAELGSNASNFYDYGELGNIPGMSTATQNPSWMDKLSGYLPQVTSAAKTVGTGLDYAQKGMGLYSLYNKYNNANNNAAIANQIQGNSSQIANNDAAIQDQIRGINEQIGKIPTLESLYGTDSAYAKNLMKQLAAKDAASGRNSQYAPRLEEFNGKLAAVAGDYANKYAQQVGALNNSIASLYRERTGASTALTNNAKAIADLNNASNISKTQTLSSLYDQYKSSGLSNALQNYFKNNGSISGPESSVSTWDDQGY